MKCHRVLSVGLLVAVLGCGGTGTPPDIPSTEEALKVSGKDQLKQRLEGIAASGAGGSGLAGLSDAIKGLQGSDAALADQLLKDLSVLENMQNPEQIKAQASKMVAKIK